MIGLLLSCEKYVKLLHMLFLGTLYSFYFYIFSTCVCKRLHLLYKHDYLLNWISIRFITKISIMSNTNKTYPAINTDSIIGIQDGQSLTDNH